MIPNREAAACRLWPLLARVAKRLNPTITCGALAEAAELPEEAVRLALGLIHDYCMAVKLPPLDSAVLSERCDVIQVDRQQTPAADEPQDVAHITQFSWEALGNPFSYASNGTTMAALADWLVRAPEEAEAVYALVKIRGVAKLVFRRVLWTTYRRQCGMCGLTFDEALEATHVVPWDEASPRQRMSPTNGLLLCATHRRLFTEGRLTVTPDYRVAYRPAAEGPNSAGPADIAMGVALHGQRLFLPESPQHWPDRDALAHHYRHQGWSQGAT